MHSAKASETGTQSASAPKSRRPQGTKRGRPSSDEKNRRIDHLIDVTTRIFVDEGYEAVTTRRISETAGISAKSIYAWFPDKLALFTEVMNRLPARLQSRGPTLPLSELSLEEALYQQAKTMIENLLHRESVAVAKFLNREGYKFPEFRTFVRDQNLSVNIARIRNILEQKLPRILPDGELQDNAMLFSYLVLGEVSRNIVHDLDPPTPARVEQYAKRAAKLFTSGVMTP